MQTITTIGLDIAKSVFQVHSIDAGGNVIFRRQLKRRHVLAFFEKLPPCLVGKAEHMAAPTNAALVKKTLANSEPSTHGPKQTS